MAKRGKTPKVDDAARLHLFLDRARRIVAHPLAVKDPNQGVTMTIYADADRNPIRMELHLADPPSWKELASLVRPIIYLEDEPVSINGILNLVARLDETQRPRIAAIRASLQSWRTSEYWSIQVLPPDGSDVSLPDGMDHQLYAAYAFERGDPRLEEELRRHDAPMIPDYRLAEIYFYGELWHSHPEEALALAAASPFELSDYLKAAEVRSRYCVPWIMATADVIERGLASGRLPSYEPPGV